MSRDRDRDPNYKIDCIQGITEGGTAASPPPSRWHLVTIRATIDWLHGYSLSGVWSVLQRCGLKLHSAAVQHFSPDPDYQLKVFRLKKALREAARNPRTVAALFLDEFGYTRWPEPAPDWSEVTPIAYRSQTNNQQWRTIGAMNALTGKVSYLDAYIIDRAKVIEFYDQLNQTYRRYDAVYVIQDNWSIHQHPDVLQALAGYPRMHPLWLPTYAPWLNPIEKLWRWVRQDILKLHRVADEWDELRHRVRAFFDQFTHGSTDLLRYVGLLVSEGIGLRPLPNTTTTWDGHAYPEFAPLFGHPRFRALIKPRG